MPENTVKVDRSTKWGNPFPYRSDPAAAVRSFRNCWLRGWIVYPSVEETRRQLRGKNLACWCPLDAPCHADVLLEIANP